MRVVRVVVLGTVGSLKLEQTFSFSAFVLLL